jgi:DNA-binding MarR family transcriptional regulator
MNTKLLSEQEHEFIMQEFKNIPQIGLPNITLKDSMIEIIEYVNRQKNMNLMVTFKKLGKDLAISKSTVAKRIRFLENQKLIITSKSGRSKSISLTDKGEALIKKIRKTKSSE